MNFTFQIFLLSTCLFYLSCHSPKEVTEAPTEVETITIAPDSRLVMNRGACHGNCPVYSLIIEFPGKAQYIGKRFTDKPGLYEKSISDSLFQSLILAFEDANFWLLDDIYPSQIVDLSEIELIYFKNGMSKSVKGTLKRPENVIQLEAQLVAIAESDGWIKVESTEDESGSNKTQIVIETQEKIVLTKWVRKYNQYRLMFKDRMHDNEWLVSWDQDKISGEDLLNILSKDPEIVRAYFKNK